MPGRASTAGAQRLQAAWQRHPLVSVLRLRRRLVFCRNLLLVVKAGLPISTVTSLIAATALATAVVKMLGVIFGTIRPALELPLGPGLTL